MSDPEDAYDYARMMRVWWDARGDGSWASSEKSDLSDWLTMQNARKDISWELEKERLDR